MASAKFSRKEFEKHIKLTKVIEEKIPLFGTGLESISEEEIIIEVNPNRPDLLSMHGFLRAFKAFLGKETGLKKYRLHTPEDNYKVMVDSSVSKVRPFTACAIVKNLNFDDEKIKEIVDLQEKLHSTLGRNRKKLAIGIYPLEKITLPIKYEARKPKDIIFVPLESNKKMNAEEILNKHPTGKSYAHLLKNYSEYPIFIDSKNNILSMPPIINSHETGKVTEETKDVFIECSGNDLESLKKTLNIITTTLADMGGKVYQMNLQYGKNKIITPDLSARKIKISIDKANSLLGLNLKEKDLEKLLPRMGYDYKKPNVSIPAWRTDIMHEVDIIEDIAIAYGYNNLIPELPSVATSASESKEEIIKNKIAEILIGLNLLEVSSYHLIKEEEADKIKLKDRITVDNAKTEYKILRPNLYISALRILSENKDNEYPQKIFEIGKVFSKSETSVKEQTNLMIALAPGNFTIIKQILESLLHPLNINSKLTESRNEILIEGRTAEISINGEKTGFIGEVHPSTLKDFGVKMPVSLLEINIDEIISILGHPK
ncbi:MAG: phenylalanine--tRNA ligase subunit beta [Nanoarchaeota archaeon]